MAAQKRGDGERERDLVEIATLYAKSWTYQAIADKINKERPYQLTKQQIYYDVKEIVKNWREEHKEKIDGYLVQQLNKLDLLELEYWNSWERSKGKKKEKTHKEGITSEGGTYDETAIKSYTEVGDPSYLAGVERCIEKRSKLLGLFTEKLEVKGETGPLVFNLIVPKNPEQQ